MTDKPGTSKMEVVEESPNKARDDEIEKLFQIVDIIIDTAGNDVKAKVAADDAAKVIDLDFSSELSVILMAVFTCMRKRQNTSGNAEKYAAYEAKLMGVTVSIAGTIEVIKAKGISLNFIIATPIVELMTLFRNSFDEVRTGVTMFQVRSGTEGSIKKVVGANNEVVWKQTLSMYGLNNKHIPLVQGITFPPKRKTDVVRSLGPLAQAILLIQEENFQDEIESALKNSLQMLPGAPEIARYFRDARMSYQVQGIMAELGDLLLMTTAPPTQKMFLPLLVLRKMWSIDYKAYSVQWSFSGIGAMILYNNIAHDYKVQLKTGGAADHASQVVFHACFGTYLDDLGVLPTITTRNGEWNKRKELKMVFQERASKQPKKISLIKFKLFPKMAQALQTKSLGNVNTQSIGRPSFSGFRKRLFTGEFKKYIGMTGPGAIIFSSDPLQLRFALKKLKDNILFDRKEKKMTTTGTKTWMEYNSEHQLVESSVIPEKSGSYFFGH